ncbi:hypothetical protein CHS0354_028661 [Potamilus streckersoni]|uniref:Uncharacterized protein n=1 Tax=Potamilus streckersoni TaxID=2493646 RepID=A0AAE0SWY6_9BIVA|nr:hypothetical protein CHS0354_028661 [Potamilus streckersoni]
MQALQIVSEKAGEGLDIKPYLQPNEHSVNSETEALEKDMLKRMVIRCGKCGRSSVNGAVEENGTKACVICGFEIKEDDNKK